MKKLGWIFILVLMATTASAVEITEINPNLNEELSNPTAFVEIKTNKSLTNTSLYLNEKNFALTSTKNRSSNYSLIISEEFNHSELDCSVYSAEEGFESQFNETNGTVKLYENEEIIASLNYTNAEINKSLIEPWNISVEKAPCKTNPYLENITKNGTDDKSCKIDFNTNTDKKIYEHGDTVKINHVIKNHTGEFEISYWIEDLYGEVVKRNFTTTNTNQKRWTANAKGEAFLLKSIMNAECGENKEGEVTKKATKPIIVKNEQTNDTKESGFKINDIDSSPEFGTAFEVDLGITKGDTRKYSIDMYVEGEENRVSDITTIHARGSNKEYRAKLPVALENNCDEVYEEGDYNLVIDGLGIKKEKQIQIEDNKAGCVEIEKEDNVEGKETDIEINDIDSSPEFGTAFEVDLGITKGDTRKYSIDMYVEGEENRVSDITTIHARGSNKEYRAKVPIALRNNCDENYKEGDHTFIIEGLGIEKEEIIEVKDNQAGCTEKIIEKETEIPIEPEPEPQIRSFYTLHRTYNEKINLYATFENINKTKNATFSSMFENKSIQIKNNSKITIQARAKDGRNLYALNLENYDTKYIEVNFSEGSNSSSSRESGVENKTQDDNINDMEQEEAKEEKNLTHDDDKKTQNEETSGEELYKSSGERSQSTAKYFFLVILAISLPYAIIKHRRKLYKTPFILWERWQNKK